MSLLGTFAGPHPPEENWQPNKSTIMQVLLSIQSNIFIEKPLFNVPGFREGPHAFAADGYNDQARFDTFRFAICNWFTAPNSQSLWKVLDMLNVNNCRM
jgi:hypothetical protein